MRLTLGHRLLKEFSLRRLPGLVLGAIGIRQSQTVAREEAKAFLKASGPKPSRRRRKVSPTDVSGVRVEKDCYDNSDISPPISACHDDAPVASNVSISNPYRSPESRRREEALVFARVTRMWWTLVLR